MVKFPHISKYLRRLWPTLGYLPATFALCAVQLSGNYAPGALAVMTLAGAGWSGLCALAGTAIGALVFFDFQPGLRLTASAILIYATSIAFYDTQLYNGPAFRPAASAAAAALVESVWLIARPLRLAAIFLLSLAAQWQFYRHLSALQGSTSAKSRQELLRPAVLCLCFALLPLESSHFSLGRALLGLPLLLYATAAPSLSAAALTGFAAGLWVDLSCASEGFLYAATAAFGCALARMVSRRTLSAALYAIGAVIAALLWGVDKPTILLWEALTGAALWAALPRQPFAAKVPAAVPALPPPKQQLERSAEAFRDLYDSFFRSTAPAPPENPSVIFDRTAQQVCRRCVLQQNCWQQDYNTTYSAFNDAYPALLRRGQAQAQDFPLHFSSRCVHMQEFVTVLNGELRTFLLRRQYRQRLAQARQQARDQYAHLGDLLGDAAIEVSAAAPLGYRIGSSLRPRGGCQVCGDQLAVFEVGSTLYLLLSDGMGSGESAHREAAMTVRLLRQFLEAGIRPAPALQTLNDAMALRGEEGGGFTTIDLLALQRGSGGAELYKYGAAPSYLKRSGAVNRFTASALPVGLQNGAHSVPCCRFPLPGGSIFVMVSDGIADETDDEWLQNLLTGWSGSDAEALTRLIMAESRNRKGLADDCAVLVVSLTPPDGEKTAI